MIGNNGKDKNRELLNHAVSVAQTLLSEVKKSMPITEDEEFLISQKMEAARARVISGKD